jgi:thiamine-phosphate pyrophosphorylase
MAESCLLYYITDRKAFPGNELAQRRALLEKISECARAGVDYIQLREKDLSPRELESLARKAVGVLTKLRTENRELRTSLLINSRTDVALAIKTDGIHLRSDDISPADARRIWQASCGAGTYARESSQRKPLIAVSCHSPAEVIRAASDGADFAVFAPIFEKKDAANLKSAGLASLQQACHAKIPALALGGITLENARSCLTAGAAGIAAIRLFQENNVAGIVKQLRS